MSYKTLALSEFCNTGSGGTPSRSEPAFYDGGTIPWVKSGELRENIIFDTEEYVTDLAVQKTSVKLAPKGSILLAMYGATVGRMAILGIDATTNQAICHIVPDKNLADRDYLYHCLQYKVPELLSKAIGGAQPNISQQIIKRLQIPLPPLAEQQRIAAILDKADELRAKRRAALAKLDTLLQATFLHMFGDPVTNPMGWPEGRIGDLASRVNYGTSKKAGEKGEFPIVRMGNITYQGGWDFSSLKYIDFDKNEQGKYLVQKGDILFNRTNSRELVGKTAVYREEVPMAFAGYLVRLTTNEKADPEFLSAFMNTPQIKQYLQENCKSIVGMANINAQEFQAIKIPIPPIHLQHKYSIFVDGILKQRKSQIKSAEFQDNLFHTLQQRAFKGEL